MPESELQGEALSPAALTAAGLDVTATGPSSPTQQLRSSDRAPWKEIDPDSLGIDPHGLEAVLKWLESRLKHPRFGGQLVVLRRGRVVLDRTVGSTNLRRATTVTPLSRFLIYSLGKPYAALCVHLLAERGQVSLDARVAEYWPAYAQNGKEDVTVRHVLQHRTGAPMSKNAVAEALDLASWGRSIRRIERTRPRYAPGSTPAYHAFSYGFICGEIVRRVTGMPITSFVDENILRPIGLTMTTFGLPPAAWDERVANFTPGGERINVLLFNRHRYRTAVCPSATTAATAREVALFYEMLRNGGELSGTRVLAPETVAAAMALSADDERDELIKRKVRWTQGFMLGGGADKDNLGHIMGRRSSDETFGFSGEACCTAWCDPGRELVFAYLTNKVEPVPAGVIEQGEIADLVLDACR